MPISAKRKKELYNEQNGRCVVHGGPVPIGKMQVDRIIPGAHGGRYEPGNVQLLCGPCNQRKGARLLPRG